MVAPEILVFIVPSMSLLGFIDLEMLSRCNDPIHNRPLCNWRAMDTGTACDRNSSFFQERIID